MKPQTKIPSILLTVLLSMFGVISTLAQLTSANSISFQGALNGTNGQPLPNGLYTLGFNFYDAMSGGNQIGTTITNSSVTISAGIASLSVQVDPAAFNGQSRYLGVSVNGGQELSPRMLITTVPYAIRAATGGDESGAFSAGSLSLRNGVTTGNHQYFYAPLSKWLLPAPFQVQEAASASDGIPVSNWLQGGGSATLYKAVGGGDYHSGFGFVEAADYTSSAIAYISYLPNSAFQVRQAQTFLNEPVGSGSIALFTVRANGNIGIATETPQARLDVNGTARVQILQITGGADLAEHLNVSDSHLTDEFSVRPGMVVSIDPTGNRKFKLSDQPYDRKRVGIISGGNGVKPGLVLSDQGNPQADGDQPVALTGQVWCHAEATFGPINPGDLLTTSSTPGHAMRVSDDAKARFAVLGQALTGLKEGRGWVQVLVGKQ